MTDDELEAALRPFIALAVERGRLLERRRIFSEQPAPNGHPRPPAEFGPADVPQLYRYFAPDDAGHFPGDFHEMFGMSADAFARASGLRRVTVRRGGRTVLVWSQK